MDAPKGRYRVVEKDGRLVVIDNQSGAPVSSSIPPPRASGPPGASSQPVIAAGKGAIDAVADFLLTMAVHEWDGEGRAVIRWRTQGRDGREFRWDAALDATQQRRLGRGLLAIGTAAPLFVLIVILGGLGALTLPVLALIGLLLAWGVWTIFRLMKETGAPLDDLG